MKKYIFFLAVVLFSMVFFSCNGDDTVDNSPAPKPVTNLTYDKTNGGAIIHYDLPVDENLLFVRAEYTNTLKKEVSKVSSRYENKIEIDGFNDLDSHSINLYAVGSNGKKSTVATIDIVPDTSHIEIIKKTLVLEPILGGVRATWRTPINKTVFIYVDYDDGETVSQRILSRTEQGDAVFSNVRGLDSIPYHFSISVEDFSGNKTDIADKGTHKPKPELKISKSTWKLHATLNKANGNSSEGKSENFFDDIIDVRDIGGTNNSYFIVERGNNGGVLKFFNEQTVTAGEQPLMFVVDMGRSIMLSRFLCYQRAFHYPSRINDIYGASTGTSTEYAYYKDDNLKSFLFFATNNASDITAQNVWENPTMVCDFGGPFTDGFVPLSKIEEAIAGHEFELPDVMGPYRYFVMGLTGTYGSEIQACFSEITLFGTYVD